jgi:hypothetical protein
MDDMNDTSTSAKSPLWIRLMLLVSLALNLLVVGVVAGFFISGGPEKRVDRSPRDIGSVYMRALDSEDRRALRRDFMSGLASQGRDREAVVTDLQAALTVLRASPFDATAFRQAMADQSKRRSQREEIGRQALTARVADMTDSERAAYADRIEKGLAELAQRVRR